MGLVSQRHFRLLTHDTLLLNVYRRLIKNLFLVDAIVLSNKYDPSALHLIAALHYRGTINVTSELSSVGGTDHVQGRCEKHVVTQNPPESERKSLGNPRDRDTVCQTIKKKKTCSCASQKLSVKPLFGLEMLKCASPS